MRNGMGYCKLGYQLLVIALSQLFKEQQLASHLSQVPHVIVITFYSPSCHGQETAKGGFGLRVKLPPAHLSTTHGGDFTLSL